MFQALKDLPPHPIPRLQWLEGEAVGVLFFGFVGLIVALVPFLDRGAAAGRPRRVLNFLAAVWVAFIIFMTARSLMIRPPQDPPAKVPPASAAGPEETPVKATP